MSDSPRRFITPEGFARIRAEYDELFGIERPKIVEVVTEMIRSICAKGVSVLLVEQKLTIAMRVSKRVYVMGHGQIVFEGTPDDLRRAPDVRRNWLEVN